MDKSGTGRTRGTKVQTGQTMGSLLVERSGQALSAVNPACGVQNQSSLSMPDEGRQPPVNPACGVHQAIPTGHRRKR